jgi:hypothetical protein
MFLKPDGAFFGDEAFGFETVEAAGAGRLGFAMYRDPADFVVVAETVLVDFKSSFGRLLG